MRELQLERVRDSKVAEDVSRVSQLPPPLTEKRLKSPIYGRAVLTYLSKTDISCQAIYFLESLIELLKKNGHTLMLKPDGVLSIYAFIGRNREKGELGRLDSSLGQVLDLKLDSKNLGIPPEQMGDFASLAFEIFLQKSSLPIHLEAYLFNTEDIITIDRATRVIFEIAPGIYPKRATFLNGDEILLTMDVKGLELLGKASLILNSEQEIIA